MELFRDYSLDRPFQNTNAGFSRWTTGSRKGRKYFLKEFMNPVFPMDYTVSPELRKQRMQICMDYERYTREMVERVNRASDGNIVRVLEFFREGSHYYQVSEMVDETITLQELAARPLQEKLMVCYLLTHSLARLHSEKVVHADIKETNVMLRKTDSGRIIPKLIDFGSSFLEERPISEEDDLGGDQLYLSPEAFLFILGEGGKPDRKVDIFALGLLMHQYLTGELPVYDTAEYLYPYEAVLDGTALGVSDKIPVSIREMIVRMLRKEPAERVSATEAEEILHALLFPGINAETVKEEKKEKKDDSGSAPRTPKKMNDWFHPAGDL